jgi:hypothetical protein
MMKGRTVLLFVALVLVTALVGFYAGLSTSSPRAAADAQVDPPGSSEEPARADGSGPSRSSTGSTGQASPSKGSGAGESASTASRPKDPAAKASPPRKDGSHAGSGTQPGQTPAKPPVAQPQQAGPVRFGPVTTAGRASEMDIAGDRRALTATFSDFEVTVEPESAEPDATKSFTMTVPLTAGVAGETLRVHPQGFAFLDGGAKASVTLQGGGRQIIKGFATGADDSFVETLELPARPGVTYQLKFAITLDRGAGAEGTGYLNIVSIDIGIS